MSPDRHHLLELFERLHEKYDIREAEYKEFVEALAGKKEIDTENAKFVVIEFDRLTPVLSDGKFTSSKIKLQHRRQVLCQVSDNASNFWWTGYDYMISREELEHVAHHWREELFMETDEDDDSGERLWVRDIEVLVSEP